MRRWLVGFAVYSVGISAVAFLVAYGWTGKAARAWAVWSAVTVALSALVGAAQDWRARRREQRPDSN